MSEKKSQGENITPSNMRDGWQPCNKGYQPTDKEGPTGGYIPEKSDGTPPPKKP